jgi:[protein-PII] uridylyltransferase
MRRMNQYGILSFYLPAWRRIVGQMQHDLFHVTVDQHILQVLRNVRRFMVAEHAHEYPLLTRLATSFEKPWLIYIAALFHDIAKGRGGDHSKLGMKDARDFCESHGLDETDTSSNGWSAPPVHVQRGPEAGSVRPRSDPRFAALVKTERRLTALYILTHADIRGTSPKVWNGWKGKLLEDLFFATQRLCAAPSPSRPSAPRSARTTPATCCATTACARAPRTPCGPSSTPSSCATTPRRSPGTRACCTTGSKPTSRSSRRAPARAAKACR